MTNASSGLLGARDRLASKTRITKSYPLSRTMPSSVWLPEMLAACSADILPVRILWKTLSHGLDSDGLKNFDRIIYRSRHERTRANRNV